MADIGSSNVVYTISKNKKLEDGRHIIEATLAFGNATLTYPAGGVPLLKGSLGCAYVIDSLVIEDKGGSGYSIDYDKVNAKIRMFQAPAISGGHTHSVPSHTHNLFLKDADQLNGATTAVNAAPNKLGANTGSDITVTGVAGTSGSGGIVAVAAGTSGSNSTVQAASALSEITGVAIAAQTLKITVIGY